MQVTLIPISAKQVPDTNPTYPLPTIAILIDLQFLKSRFPVFLLRLNTSGENNVLFYKNRVLSLKNDVFGRNE